MEYNSSRPRLIIPEYGRNVQKMVDFLTTIEDREKRNTQARNLIEIIGNLNPQIRDNPDFKQKLWDHMFIMSDFRLDVDSPYEMPEKETLNEKPETVPYPQSSRKYRQYGHVIKDMVKYVATLEPGDYKKRLVKAVANHMKKTYLIWNKDTVEDDVIFNEMMDLAGGKINVDDIELSNKEDLVRFTKRNTNKKNNSGSKNKRKRKNKSHK